MIIECKQYYLNSDLKRDSCVVVYCVYVVLQNKTGMYVTIKNFLLKTRFIQMSSKSRITRYISGLELMFCVMYNTISFSVSCILWWYAVGCRMRHETAALISGKIVFTFRNCDSNHHEAWYDCALCSHEFYFSLSTMGVRINRNQSARYIQKYEIISFWIP